MRLWKCNLYERLTAQFFENRSFFAIAKDQPLVDTPRIGRAGTPGGQRVVVAETE